MMLQLAGGLLLGVVISLVAYRFKALSTSGALAAALTGGMVFGLGGLAWAVLLLTFFISSSALSRAFARRKAVMNEKFSKGSRRDWGQVLANGGVGAFLAGLFVIMPGQLWVWPAFIGSMAAVNADTWATELGVLNPGAPRLITTGRVVECGTSGGVSLYGNLAVLGGAGLIGLAAWIVQPAPVSIGWISLAAAVFGGLAGAFTDSLLGATVQAIYTCPSCQKETERHPLHVCGTPTELKRGWKWLNNDLVNFSCSLMGAIMGGLLVVIFTGV